MVLDNAIKDLNSDSREIKDLAHCIRTLYGDYAGIKTLPPEIRDFYIEHVVSISLKQKRVMHSVLNTYGSLCFNNGNTKDGEVWYNSANYFWKNFVVLEGGKYGTLDIPHLEQRDDNSGKFYIM